MIRYGVLVVKLRSENRYFYQVHDGVGKSGARMAFIAASLSRPNLGNYLATHIAFTMRLSNKQKVSRLTDSGESPKISQKTISLSGLNVAWLALFSYDKGGARHSH